MEPQSEGRTPQPRAEAAAAGSTPALASTSFRLGYADTDPAGILYYAAWFPFMERLQTGWFADNGLRQDTLKDRFDFWMVNARVECDYLVAVSLLDEIRLELRLGTRRSSAITMEHTMWRTALGTGEPLAQEQLVARATMTLVTVTPTGGATRIPALLGHHLDAWAVGQRIDPEP